MHPLILLAATATPDPTLGPTLSNDQIGPGFLGFLATAFVVAITVFLIRDMVKRIRRVRYRAQAGGAEDGHGPRSGYIDIPIMSEEEVRAAGAAVLEDPFPARKPEPARTSDGGAAAAPEDTTTKDGGNS